LVEVGWVIFAPLIIIRAPFYDYKRTSSSKQLSAPAPMLPSPRYMEYLVNLHTLSPQISPRQINLLHEFCVCLGNVVECENAEAEFEKEIGTEGNEGPEWQLCR